MTTHYVMVRDDDVSFFTDPKMLNALYPKDFPLNISLIPTINTNARQAEGSISRIMKIASQETDRKRREHNLRRLEKITHDMSIPPKFRGDSKPHPFFDNKQLVRFITDNDNILVCQHGCNHEPGEFFSDDTPALQSKISLGKALIEEGLGIIPEYFVAPSDRISQTAMRLLRYEYKLVSTGKVGWKDLPKRMLATYTKNRAVRRNYLKWSDFVVLEHPGYLTSRFLPVNSFSGRVMQAVDSNEYVVLVNHHWEYFFDWEEQDNGLVAEWKKVLMQLLERKDVEFIKFSDFYKRKR